MSKYAKCAAIIMNYIRTVQKLNMSLDFHDTMEGLSLEVTENVSTWDDNGPLPCWLSLKNIR